MSSFLRYAIAFVFLFGSGVRPALAELSEDQIKAAYVFNFVKFAEWPAGAAGEVVLCVVGSGALNGALAALDRRKAGERELRVVQYANADSSLAGCQVAFIGESERRHFVSVIRALGGAPVLTISDIEDFAEKGGGIGLRQRDDKIVFEVNLSAVQGARLHLSGQLLNLAARVFGR